jgi:hypothetical protein
MSIRMELNDPPPNIYQFVNIGDSGNSQMLVGIVSWGSDNCGDINAPCVYSSVSDQVSYVTLSFDCRKNFVFFTSEI